MHVLNSKNRKPRKPDGAIARLVNEVSEENLRAYVDVLSFPRHYVVEKEANVRARDLLLRMLEGYGYLPTLQGVYDNIVVTSGEPNDGGYLLLGAHYDSVPDTPGADDNASAVALCLECARLLKKHNIGSTMIVLFNREEDGLLGSTEFVAALTESSKRKIAEAHVFEMVGFCDRSPNSQRMPPGLPSALAPSAGDFLALIANSSSNAIAENLLTLASTYVSDASVLALKIYLGVERLLGHLYRSDHAPFWRANIPAIMWTDTSEFRNPHYHLTSDTPDTLDYEFLTQVTKLALARAIVQAWS
ncbi:MAG: M28 family peptidase [Gemmataceae bacterium]